jgi:dimeric dUTPase (all-alpha-NTP-PPase superfamily)
VDINFLTREQFLVLLTLQAKLNFKIRADWADGKTPFLRAAFVEAAEALDHYGWKWWKKTEPDIVQVQIELIDILHFYLSHVLVQNNGVIEKSALAIEFEMHDVTPIFFDGAAISLESDVPYLLEVIAGLAVRRRHSFLVLNKLMELCKLSGNDVVGQYVSKNILNIFRQDHGYNDGTYQKIWEGQEDNVFLGKIMSEMDMTSTEFPDKLYSALSGKYAQVVGA